MVDEGRRLSSVVVVLAAAAAVAVLVVNETLLGEVVGVVESAVVVAVMMFVDLNRADHVDARTFLPARCNAHARRARPAVHVAENIAMSNGLSVRLDGMPLMARFLATLIGGVYANWL